MDDLFGTTVGAVSDEELSELNTFAKVSLERPSWRRGEPAELSAAVRMNQVDVDAQMVGTTVHAVPVVGDALLVTEGVLDDAARRAFTEGQCHAFAYALHLRTGWDVVALYEFPEWRSGLEVNNAVVDHSLAVEQIGSDASHFACMRPDGRIVDIVGAYSVEGFYDAWAESAPYPHREWGVMPPRESLPEGASPAARVAYEQDYDHDVTEAFIVHRSRLVKVRFDDPRSLLGVYPRRATAELADTLVGPLLATLGD